MTISIETLAARIDTRFGERVTRVTSICDELTYEVAKADLVDVATALRDDDEFADRSADRCLWC